MGLVQLKNLINKGNPLSEDHIIKMDLDKDVVLAIDENWNELCRFEIECDLTNDTNPFYIIHSTLLKLKDVVSMCEDLEDCELTLIEIKDFQRKSSDESH